eukprot:TRINITY_DN1395_c0_g2_i2.p1 TRINITY_DN1395_c0_g2~~TRINITY_DN1395_c0_g2_i2.p1  ORF type:complete len:149 (-),score=20.64 TRINITY_DN1395_c0_g2_i2:585-1031(-)
MSFEDDYSLAVQLQREEEKKKANLVRCQLTGKMIPVDKLYILDDCSCKYDKQALVAYVSDAIKTQVNCKCPSSSCTATISVRDMKELMPVNKEKGITPTVSSKQSTQRIQSELRHILKTKPQTQVILCHSDPPLLNLSMFGIWSVCWV